MLEIVKKIFEREHQPPKPRKRGQRWKLVFQDRILVTLEYWREYRTYFQIWDKFWRFLLLCTKAIAKKYQALSALQADFNPPIGYKVKFEFNYLGIVRSI
ncbi:MAG: hypothetical protein ACFBSE_21075 [Prochloraceae cyanobacterium]